MLLSLRHTDDALSQFKAGVAVLDHVITAKKRRRHPKSATNVRWLHFVQHGSPARYR